MTDQVKGDSIAGSDELQRVARCLYILQAAETTEDQETGWWTKSCPAMLRPQAAAEASPSHGTESH